MKKRVLFLISAVLLLSACGTTARYSSSQRFQDGIYVNRSNTIADRQAAAAEKQEIDTLIAQTKNSEIYLLEDESATITVPGDISANTSITVKNNTGATVTIGEDADYSIYINYNPDPWYWDSWYYGSWRWSRPWYYSSWYWRDRWLYDTWYWGWSWTAPYYDPWYWGRWYDPWYWNPYHHWGWYGHPVHHHHGPVYVTNNIITSRPRSATVGRTNSPGFSRSQGVSRQRHRFRGHHQALSGGLLLP